MLSLSRAVSQSFGIVQTVTSAVRIDVNDLSQKHCLSLGCSKLFSHMPLVVVVGSGDVSKLDPSLCSSRSETISTVRGRPPVNW